MSRYIDADLLKNRISEHKRIAIHKDDIVRIISDIPTADVEEVKHGQWLVVEGENGNEVKICSHCARKGCYESTYEESFDYDYEENCYCDGYDEHREYISTRYCPYCGAKMDL